MTFLWKQIRSRRKSLWFFNQPGEVLFLPTHYTEIFKWGSMTWDVTMVMYGGEGLQMFSVSLSKCCWCFSNIFLITFQPVTFQPIDYTTLFCYVVFILWSHWFIFQGRSTLKVYLNAILSANVFQTLTKSLVVWNCDRSSVGVIASVDSVNVSILFWNIFLQLHPLYGPWRILACC